MRWSVPPAALKDDRAFVLAAVAQSGHLLQFASAPRDQLRRCPRHRCAHIWPHAAARLRAAIQADTATSSSPP